MVNFIDSIFNCWGKPRRDDPVFGRMRYMGDHAKYWEAKTKFHWAESDIEVFVEASAADNMEQQQEFFRKLTEEWPSLRDGIGQSLHQEWHRWNPATGADPPPNQFVISSMTIPKGTVENAEWEISFASRGEGHLYTVQMKGLTPIRVVAE